MALTGRITLRLPINGNSTGGEFTFFLYSSGTDSNVAVSPHLHKYHYETFFNIKGRLQFWAQHENGIQEARVLTQGDFGSWATHTNHTFQFIDPDSEVLSVVAPGGFEKLIDVIGQQWNTKTNSPYPNSYEEAASQSGTGSASVPDVQKLNSLDVWPQPDFIPRRDTLNGTTSSNTAWHNGPNYLGNNTDTTYWVANGYGPKYLNKAMTGYYQIVQPLITPEASGNYSFTESTITINGPPSDISTLPHFSLPHGNAFMVLEGTLTVHVQGYHPVTLVWGDVMYVPKDTSFTYYTSTHWCKFLYVSGGNNCLDTKLVKGGAVYNSVVFPPN
ncbi:Quercetin 2,3-dioxygenase [Fusarium oxysporum f. sp. rapae]|uniref:Quercetin 2,3-dioxygenase n=1 Tax=Fusarium oxysporum f. sp. rapae TaxID=485398 RepID=A0A8J5NMA7_FUSOX|nr:Quercetin 2,3-dioxygenase [Fusarium oxysporum f. sp. rapae]